MKLTQSLYQSSLYAEYSKNVRLQWMLVTIALIVTLSSLKYFSDELKTSRAQTQSQVELLSRLEQAANEETDSETDNQIRNAYIKWIEDQPKAVSASVAEAQALTEVEQKVGQLIRRKRLNLIGSEKLRGIKQETWQVRIEIAGQMEELDLIELLQHFDSQHKYARIASFQYSPKTSNTINMVIDLIYKRAEDV